MRAATRPDVATKHDLHSLATTFRGEIANSEERLRGEIAGMRGDLHRELRVQFYWTATLFGILLTAFVAALEIL